LSRSKSKARLSPDPSSSIRLAFLRPLAEAGRLEGGEGAVRGVAEEGRGVVDGDLPTV
jgi:hypothetical protein